MAKRHIFAVVISTVVLAAALAAVPATAADSQAPPAETIVKVAGHDVIESRPLHDVIVHTPAGESSAVYRSKVSSQALGGFTEIFDGAALRPEYGVVTHKDDALLRPLTFSMLPEFEEVTGVDLHDAGTVESFPESPCSFFYDAKPPTITVGFKTLDPGVAGLANVCAAGGAIHSALVWVDTDYMAGHPTRGADALLRREILLHEIGHALNLGHYDLNFEGHRQVMHPFISGTDHPVLRSGDQNGLGTFSGRNSISGPRRAPLAPTHIAATTAGTSTTLTWPVPAAGPAAMWDVQFRPVGSTAQTPLRVLEPSYTFTTPSVAYDVRVRAHSSLGSAPWTGWARQNVEPPTPVCDSGFTDVGPTHPFCAEVAWLADQNITTGWADGTFRPSQRILRDAMAAFLYRFAGSPPGPHPPANFSDVPINYTFANEIAWLSNEGITTGFPDGTFQPRQEIRRDAMSAFLYRLSGSPAGPFPDPGFADVPPGHAFHKEVAWMASTGITTGWDDGTFRPTQTVSRDAMAAFLYRYSQL